jgi:protein gp37
VNRKHGLPRIDGLRDAPAAVRFLSIEPLLEDLGTIDLAGIDWVIVGGESGWGSRPMDPSWVISIRDQCQANGVPFFFKQWGGAQKSKHGSQLGGRTYNEMPPRKARIALARSERMALIDELTAGVAPA